MHRLAGIGLVALSAAAFGTLAIFGRLAYAAGLNTFTILFLRFGTAALLMLGLMAPRRERLPRGSALRRLAGMGAIGYIGQSFSYLTALNYASAGLVALLLYLYPVFVALLAVVFLRERLTLGKLLALSLAVAGAALTVNPEGGQPLGIALAIGAAAIYSVYIIVGTGVLKQVSAVQSSTVIFASAGLAAGGLMLLEGPRWPTTGAGWGAMAGIVLVATILPVVTFLAGLNRIGPTNAAMLSTVEPVVTVLLAAWLFGETLKPAALLGGGLILLAVLVVTRSEMRRSPPQRAPSQA